MDISASNLWSNEKLRFIFVGAINTGFGFILFAVIQITIGPSITYIGSLVVSHLIASTLAFVFYKFLVFKTRGRMILEYFKFQSIYLGGFLVNLVALPAIVLITGLNPVLAQGITTIGLAITSYLGHKYFTFRQWVETSQDRTRE